MKPCLHIFNMKYKEKPYLKIFIVVPNCYSLQRHKDERVTKQSKAHFIPSSKYLSDN